MNTRNKKEVLIATALLCFCISNQTAVAQGIVGIENATTEVTAYFDPATKLIYACGAVVGLIGGIKVYSKWNSGDQDTQKMASGWFGACIFLVIISTILRAFFL
jgi:Domain of unknown function (DUF4134)